MPTASWIGNCYLIANKAVEGGLVLGHVAYGHWTGPVNPKCPLRGKLFRHGWVVCQDNTVFDPTRWVFENARPYIYNGPPDHYYEGDIWRDTRMPPIPEFDARLRQIPYTEVESSVIENILGQLSGVMTINQAVWIANMPYVMLGENVSTVYGWLVKNRLLSLIPIDNINRAIREGKIANPRE